MMEGARLVTSSETNPTRSWDVQRIKAMTGGDAITARAMRADNRTYQPLFKVMFSGNTLPALHNVDEAMRRRLQVIPFVVKPRVVDGELDIKIREEYPALLAWAIGGCMEWQRIGLAPPASVLKYTESYFTDQDGVGRFLAEQTTPGGFTSAGDMYRRFTEWANSEGEYRGTAKWFSARMAEHNVPRDRKPAGTVYGVSLLPQDHFAAL